MEEILASIRRIIADDQSLPGHRREREERRRRDTDEPAPASAVAQEYAEPVLEAVEPAVTEKPATATPRAVAVEEPPPAVAEIRHLRVGRPPVEAAPADEEQDPLETVDVEAYDGEDDYAEEASEETPVTSVDVHAVEPLLSSATATSVASHFEALATSMFIKEQGLLQQYAQEMMRPMLKQWLDDNLPTIVERLVRAEIERVARGGRR